MTEEQFIRIHGGPKVQTGFGQWLLADGACIRADSTRGVVLYDPSPELGQRLQAVVAYRRERLVRAQVALREYTFASYQEADPPAKVWDHRELGPAPPERDRWGGVLFAAALARVQAIYQERRAAFDAAVKEMEEIVDTRRIAL